MDWILKSFSTKELIKELKDLCKNNYEPYDYKISHLYLTLICELKKRGYDFEIKKKIKIIKNS